MSIGQAEATNSTEYFYSQRAARPTVMKSGRTHDYTRHECGADYVFETVDNGSKGYMTGQGKGVKPGDYLLLKHESEVERYQVVTIDYYASPANMWIALLLKAN